VGVLRHHKVLRWCGWKEGSGVWCRLRLRVSSPASTLDASPRAATPTNQPTYEPTYHQPGSPQPHLVLVHQVLRAVAHLPGIVVDNEGVLLAARRRKAGGTRQPRAQGVGQVLRGYVVCERARVGECGCEQWPSSQAAIACWGGRPASAASRQRHGKVHANCLCS
jgi:hypothetical protein